MNQQQDPRMDDDFARRMRRGLAAMAPSEVARTRRIRSRVAGGVAGALALALVTVVGVQVVGSTLDDQRRDEAVPPPTPSVTPSPTASEPPSPTPTPNPMPSEPTPPPGFEGVAAGVPVIVELLEPGFGDTGAAGTPERYRDVYVTCEGSGAVLLFDSPLADCSDLAPGTIVAYLGDPVYPGEPEDIVPTVDFTGLLEVLPQGQQPTGSGVAGTASVWAACGSTPYVIGGVLFECPDLYDGLVPTELAAWGIPFGPGDLVPRVTRPDGELVSGTFRFVIEPPQ